MKPDNAILNSQEYNTFRSWTDLLRAFKSWTIQISDFKRLKNKQV